MDTFVGWRNAADSNSAVAYTSYLQTYAQPFGFLSTHVGDNAFSLRKDLLNFTLMGSGGITSTDAPYLTHFSRSLNAPCWGPISDASGIGGQDTAPAVGAAISATSISKPYAYRSNANTKGAPNRFFPQCAVRAGQWPACPHQTL